MAETELLSYQDLTDHLLAVFDDSSGNARHAFFARRAARNAYRKLPDMHRWSYFDRRGQIKTVASYETGTVGFDLTGGAYERMVTLTSGTWPSWVDFGKIIISDVVYKIDERKSDTVITLTPDSHPAADVAAGTSYTIYRSVYPLPVNFRRAEPFVELSNSFFPEYLSTGDLVDALVGNYSPSRPLWYTFRNDGEYYGAMSVEFAPPPSEARTYDFIYEISPRPLLTEKYQTGTVTCTVGSTTVTGSGTTFTSKMAGSLIRFMQTGAGPPAGIEGDVSGGTPYWEQRVILSVDSTTQVTIDASLPATISGVGFTITDPLDIEHGAMMNYLFRLAEAEFATLLRDSKGMAERSALAHQTLITAMGADNRNRRMGGDSRFHYTTRLGDWALDSWSTVQ